MNTIILANPCPPMRDIWPIPALSSHSRVFIYSTGIHSIRRRQAICLPYLPNLPYLHVIILRYDYGHPPPRCDPTLPSHHHHWHLPLTLPGEPAAVERLVDMMASVSDHQEIWIARCQCLVTATFRGLRLPCSTSVRVGGGEPKAQAYVGYVQHCHCRST